MAESLRKKAVPGQVGDKAARYAYQPFWDAMNKNYSKDKIGATVALLKAHPDGWFKCTRYGNYQKILIPDPKHWPGYPDSYYKWESSVRLATQSLLEQEFKGIVGGPIGDIKVKSKFELLQTLLDYCFENSYPMRISVLVKNANADNPYDHDIEFSWDKDGEGEFLRWAMICPTADVIE